MEDAAGNDLLQQFRRNPSLSVSKPQQNASDGLQIGGPYRHFGSALSPEPGRRPGIPPASPFSHFPPSAARSPPPLAAFHHSRSLSQPAFFSLDSLPPLSPPLCRDSTPTTSLSDSVSADVSMEDHDASSRSPPLPPKAAGAARAAAAAGDGLPPRKAHRRSQSEIPFAFFQSSPSPAAFPLPPLAVAPPQLVKLETNWDQGLDATNAEGAGEKKLEGDSGDELFNAFMNLDSLDTLNSSVDKREDLNSRASGTKTNGDSSENEAESRVKESGGSGVKFWSNHGLSVENREGIKRSAVGNPGPIETSARHCRSLSMDSFVGKLNFGEESPKLPPSPGFLAAQTPQANSKDGTSNVFSLEFGNGEFSPAEMKKIVANEKLAEMALTDPKRVKRILANRQSAARSKERKVKYIAELEHKVQTLQTEATTLSAQLTLLQRDSAGLTSQNNELKFRLQAMEQQAQLRDALNEALTAEVQRLKLSTGELADGRASNSLNQQLSINPQMFQLQQQQPSQLPLYQLQLQQQQNSAGKNHESNN